MKRWLTVLAVLLLLLTGCAEEIPEQTLAPTAATTTAPTEPDPGLYDPNHALTKATAGAITAFPLEGTGYRVYSFGEKLLLAQFAQNATVLTVLSGENCVREAELTIKFAVPPEDLWAGGTRVAYYDRETQTLVLLDGKLRQTERLRLPEDAITSVVADEALTTAYYGTEGKICAMDLDTGVSRLVYQGQWDTYQISHIAGDMLQCYIHSKLGDSYAIVSCQDGQLYYTGSGVWGLSRMGEGWSVIHTDGPVTERLYGQGKDMWVFRTEEQAPLMQFVGLEDGNILTHHSQDNGTQILECYDMQAKTRAASVTIEGMAGLSQLQPRAGKVWFVAQGAEAGSDVLCCWDPALSPAEPAQCLHPYYSAENPDTQALAECEAYAQQIGQTYDITVMLDGPEALKEDYLFQKEHRADALYTALAQVEAALAQFPGEYYERVFRVTENRSFQISLVRQVTGTGGEAVPDSRGHQVWEAGDSYMILPVGRDTLSQFYHQLWHMTETYVLNRNSVLDTWDWLNPEVFDYNNSYTEEMDTQYEAYLSGEERAFIDAYSMTYPREDRARFFEYAILSGNEAYFESETMQAKLNSLCWSIRKAFRWEKSKDVFLWEQYLKEPVHED